MPVRICKQAVFISWFRCSKVRKRTNFVSWTCLFFPRVHSRLEIQGTHSNAIVWPDLFFCKQLSLVVNKARPKDYENCYKNIFGTVRINCYSALKIVEFQKFSWALEQFILTVDQNNYGNKIPLSLYSKNKFY